MNKSIKLIINPYCGNSPKKLFIKDLNIAFAEGDVESVKNSVSDNITWNIVGDKVIEGKKNFVNSLEKMKNNIVSELIIENIITHGAEAAASGILHMKKGRKYSFADIYVFTSAGGRKIKSITSYIIAS